MRYSNLGLRDKGDSCLVHYYESFIQILIALSYSSTPTQRDCMVVVLALPKRAQQAPNQ